MEKKAPVSGYLMTKDPSKRSTNESRKRQNPLISVDPLKIEVPGIYCIKSYILSLKFIKVGTGNSLY